MKWSKIVQYLLGILLGLLAFAGIVGGISYLYLSQLSRMPPKPTFASDRKPTAPPPKPKPYPAIVIYDNGLLLREKPEATAQSIRTLYYEESVVVLETSADNKWQKVQAKSEDGAEDLEGWVAMGNTERTGDAVEPEQTQEPGETQENEDLDDTQVQ